MPAYSIVHSGAFRQHIKRDNCLIFNNVISQIPSHNDEHVLTRFLDGDENAFNEIYSAYWKSLYITAHNILQNNNAAEDVVQEIFTALWRRRDEVEIKSLSSYLYQAARFQAFKAIRAEKTDLEFFERLRYVSANLILQEPSIFSNFEPTLKRLIDSLPADQQEIFHMNRVLGLTYKKIAVQKNLSVKTIEKKMSQALKNIRFVMSRSLIFIALLQQ